MADRNRLELLPHGFIAFRTESGERWKHKDMEQARVGGGYRLFVSDTGEERQYVFDPDEPHDATLDDLRKQLARARVVAGGSDGGASSPELPYPFA